MSQIIQNYMFVFIAPFLAGTAVRLLLRKVKRGYLITLAFSALAVILWMIFYAVFSHGSERYGLLALQATSTAAGALLTGLTAWLRKNRDL